MRWVVKFLAMFVCAVMVAQLVYPSSSVAAQSVDVAMTQVIMPLHCDVDIVSVGQAYSVRLVPAQCARLSEARQMLHEAREHHRHH